MKKTVALFFLLVFAVQSLYTAGFTIWFYINRANIAQKQCINKSRPQLHCNGKCFLAKKILEAEKKQENEKSPGLKEWVEIAPCAVPYFDYRISFINIKFTYTAHYNNQYSLLTTKDIFHPPLMVVS